MSNRKIIHDKLRTYKKKYFLNKLIKGVILLLAIFFAIYLIINILEFSFRFNSIVRTTLFFLSLALIGVFTFRWIAWPIYQLLTLDKQLSDEKAAKQIGEYFPDIKDKLTNLLQLEKLSDSQNQLIAASITQKTEGIKLVPFEKAVETKRNRKYLKYLLYPGVAILLILLFIPSLFTESTTRIINYEKEFVPTAPFEFKILNNGLEGFRNEDFILEVSLEGNFVPEELYINFGGRRIKAKKSNESDNFNYTFQNLQNSVNFTLEAAGFRSERNILNVSARPNLKEYFVNLDYPAYTGKKDEVISNISNITVPEGTEATWNFGTAYAERLELLKEGQSVFSETSDNQLFKYKEIVMQPSEMELKIYNEKSNNANKLLFRINTIKDEYPKIDVNQLVDTLLYSYVILGGNVSDDYGLNKLKLFYKSANDSKYQVKELFLNKNQSSSSFYYQWNIDSINLGDDVSLSYYLEISDNDRIHGSKKTRSSEFSFKTPSQKEIEGKIDKSSKAAEKQIDKTLEKARDLKEKLKEIDERLKTEQKVDWQEKRMIEDLIKQKEALSEELKKLQEENKALNEAQERFKNPSSKIQEKVKQLQNLMNDVLDEETKKLYEELRKLLEENSGVDQIQQQLNEIQKDENSVEEELERALELFKRLKMETKVEETIDKLDKLQKEQEKLAEETKGKKNDQKGDEKSEEGNDDDQKEGNDENQEGKEEKSGNEKDKKSDLDEISKKQEEIQKKLQEIKKDTDEIEEINQSLENPDALQDFEKQEEEINESINESLENLDKKQKNKASQNQQKASDQMKKMKEMMQEMQAGAEMQMMQENLDNLRDIVDNLVTLSFDQEQLMNDFRGVNQSDPRFIALSQTQLKLKDDSQIIQDSLLALAKRVFQLSSFVTREVETMNQYMDESVEAIRDRVKSKAVSSQQFAMTSMNNLAILLDDVLQQMQQNMADAMGKPQKGGKKKGNMPSMSELQKQLSQKIQDLKKSGKSGRQLSEELAKLAAEQEMLRREMEKQGSKPGLDPNGEKEGGKDGNLQKLIKQMKENEEDLVNKRLDNELIRRQQDIITRMLEAENAQRERELDEQREAESPDNIGRKLPPEFEEYFKSKEREIELLKTIPVKLNPFYKKEVNKYFKRINQ